MVGRYMGGGVVLVVGVEMMVGCVGKEDKGFIADIGGGVVVFARSVSLDSFCVGLS
uniref:manganese efflux pump n=1 Tax=Bacillus pumilus TaxID=1408 RepID=UPI0034D95D3B